MLTQHDPRLRRHIDHNGHTAGEERGVEHQVDIKVFDSVFTS